MSGTGKFLCIASISSSIKVKKVISSSSRYPVEAWLMRGSKKTSSTSLEMGAWDVMVTSATRTPFCR